ncbi:2'-5' RNA ligase family protein [Sphingomonas ginkgonis]|uniref:2'-5' RNA ligase family protein n=1 Tax=Sphingomonas ginkgonis TaxID=2315330 RepID=A0A3R9Z6P5_9SPHN|nr:2'-5' RNA ligase family protein [Sphingomonas ginkgonis]RST31145.1 2'-5' RNA ligase family protein [Sphingomonas ginkgonis]
MSGALIVTAEMGAEDSAWLDGQRTRHFPPERNQLAAHLTMFHALPPSSEPEAERVLAREAAGPPPRATLAGLMNLGGGVAYRVVSDELDGIRARIAHHFHGLLTAQDGQGWRPHVTIQNKVSSRQAKLLFDELQASFQPRPLAIRGLLLHRYLGGPWDSIGKWRFRG